MGRIGATSEIAGLAVSLFPAQALYVTGTTILPKAVEALFSSFLFLRNHKIQDPCQLNILLEWVSQIVLTLYIVGILPPDPTGCQRAGLFERNDHFSHRALRHTHLIR